MNLIISHAYIHQRLSRLVLPHKHNTLTRTHTHANTHVHKHTQHTYIHTHSQTHTHTALLLTMMEDSSVCRLAVTVPELGCSMDEDDAGPGPAVVAPPGWLAMVATSLARSGGSSVGSC